MFLITFIDYTGLDLALAYLDNYSELLPCNCYWLIPGMVRNKLNTSIKNLYPTCVRECFLVTRERFKNSNSISTIIKLGLTQAPPGEKL